MESQIGVFNYLYYLEAVAHCKPIVELRSAHGGREARFTESGIIQ